MIKKTLFLLLVFLNLLFYFFQNRQVYLRKFDAAHFTKLYSQSQYVIGAKSESGIGDDGLYAFAGYYYLIQRGDPSQVNFENPPLGKYLIGLSILLFGNELVIYFFYGVALLFITFLTAKLLFKDSFWAGLAVVILSFDPFFKNSLRFSMLDLPLTLFFLSGLYFYLKANGRFRYFFTSSIFFGLSLSSKFFPGLTVLLAILIIDIFFHDRKNIISYLISLLAIPLVYLLSHLAYFYYHPSLFEFLRYQKWILVWRMGNPRVLGNILGTIFLGRYQNWWGEEGRRWIFDSEWTPFFPVFFILAFLSLPFLLRKKDKRGLVIFGLSISLLFYLAVGTVGISRYLWPVYPLILVLAIYTLRSGYSIIRPWQKLTLKRLKDVR